MLSYLKLPHVGEDCYSSIYCVLKIAVNKVIKKNGLLSSAMAARKNTKNTSNDGGGILAIFICSLFCIFFCSIVLVYVKTNSCLGNMVTLNFLLNLNCQNYFEKFELKSLFLSGSMLS